MANIGIINNRLTPVLIYIALNIRVKKIMLISVLSINEGKIMI